MGEDGKLLCAISIMTDITRQKEETLFLSRVFNMLPNSIYIKDMNTGKVVINNEESTKLFHLEEGMSFEDIIDKKSLDYIKAVDEEILRTGKPFSGHEYLKTKLGKTIETYVHKSLLQQNNQDLLLVSRTNTTSFSNFKIHSSLFNTVMKTQGARSWNFEIDVLHKDRDFGELHTFFDMIHEDDREFVIQRTLSAIDNINSHYTIQYKADYNSTGEYKWWESTGVNIPINRNGDKFINIYGVTMDINSQKRDEEQLIEKQRQLDILLNQKEILISKLKATFLSPILYEKMLPDDDEYINGLKHYQESVLKLIDEIQDLSV